MGKKQKYYVVWSGSAPGIYASWEECETQVKGVKGAVYKSFDTREEAEQAYASPASEYIVRRPAAAPKQRFEEEQLPAYAEEVEPNALAVDAACSGNPGKMEYRGVYVGNGQQMFHFGPIFGTNNIGEFLAIVHGLAFLQQQGWDMPIYTDSRNALLWIKQKKCKTQLKRTEKTEAVFQLIERAEKWLREHTYDTHILKWRTSQWGEIPADFGRK